MDMTLCDVPVSKKYDVIQAGGSIIREWDELMDVRFAHVAVKIDNEISTMPNLEIRNRDIDRYFYVALLEVGNIYLS